MSSSIQTARRPQPSIHFPTRAGERKLRGSRRITSVSRSMSRRVSGETIVARLPVGATARPGDACRPGVSSFSGGANPAAIPGRATVRIVPSAARRRGEPVRSLRAEPAARAASRRSRSFRPPRPRAAAGCAPGGCADRPRRPRDPGPRASTISRSGAGQNPCSTGPKPGRRSRPTARIVRRSTKRSSGMPPWPSAIMRPAGERATRLVDPVPMSIRWPTGASVRASSRASMPLPSQLTPSTTGCDAAAADSPATTRAIAAAATTIRSLTLGSKYAVRARSRRRGGPDGRRHRAGRRGLRPSRLAPRRRARRDRARPRGDAQEPGEARREGRRRSGRGARPRRGRRGDRPRRPADRGRDRGRVRQGSDLPARRRGAAGEARSSPRTRRRSRSRRSPPRPSGPTG